MNNELTEIYDFVGRTAPFEQLPQAAIEDLVDKINICYLVKGEFLPPKGVNGPHFFIVRKGALSYIDQDNILLGKYGESDICSIFAYPEKYADLKVMVDEDALLYAINKQEFLDTLNNYPNVIHFFEQSAEERLKSTVSKIQDEAVLQSSLANTSIEQIYCSPAATISQQQSIKETAVKMTELGYSCLVVIDNEEHVLGIVTDKDFRRRCIAEGISAEQPVGEIMTPNIMTLEVANTAFDALVTMTSRHIHHLPITRQGKLDGMLTITDLMHYEEENALNLTRMVQKANTIAELKKVGLLLPKLQVKMSKIGTTAEQVSRSISAISTAITIRLIQMAEEQLGSPPVPYAWLSAGSQARHEQFAHSDQDNAIIIDNSVTDEQLSWYQDLAQFVCDGLNACGFIYCPGQIMATNPKWLQREQVWHSYFQQWIETPSPKALMHCSIFFDLNTLYGDSSLLERVRQQMLAKTQNASLFIAHLSKNALQFKPPLGFFRDFVLTSNGKDKKTMDLKHNGVAPIVDLARIYALQEGVSAVNTVERLKQVSGTKSLTTTSAANLIDAFNFLTSLRLKHQSTQLAMGESADNYLAPKEISRLEREHLKDAFKVIKTLQDNRQSVY